MTFEKKPCYVIDASVVLKWFSRYDEDNLEKAKKIRKDFKERRIDIISPELLIYEIANVLRYKESIEEKVVLDAINSIYEMRILSSVSQMIMEDAIKLARNFNITVYDSTYLGFANNLKYPLVTADKKLYEKIKGYPGIIYISEY
ncbi:MAG: type II toxin-antitoxin system VapC family toxin [Acidobacteriota bacterium]